MREFIKIYGVHWSGSLSPTCYIFGFIRNHILLRFRISFCHGCFFLPLRYPVVWGLSLSVMTMKIKILMENQIGKNNTKKRPCSLPGQTYLRGEISTMNNLNIENINCQNLYWGKELSAIRIMISWNFEYILCSLNGFLISTHQIKGRSSYAAQIRI